MKGTIVGAGKQFTKHASQYSVNTVIAASNEASKKETITLSVSSQSNKIFNEAVGKREINQKKYEQSSGKSRDSDGKSEKNSAENLTQFAAVSFALALSNTEVEASEDME
jgi:hypothetical protein